jgi:phage terminase large subunit-like protein
VWLLRAGRGFGKTIAGARWTLRRAKENPGARIALVGANLDDVVKLMVEGESGLIAEALEEEKPRWVASRRRVDFHNGSQAFAYSAETPEKLRGPQHHFAWADELAKWTRGKAAWDNLRLGMRLGAEPRIVVTTTPAAGPLLTRIAGGKATAVTRGRTWQNPHLPERFVAAMIAEHGGTRLGRQELEGMLFDDAAGALWTRGLVERCRTAPWNPAETGALRRIVVGVDPPASDGVCGIVACGQGADGVAYVLGDHSLAASPQGWARRVAWAAQAWGADRVIAEANNGGEMVRQTLLGAEANLPVTLVNASRGKSARAEPIVVRFENGKAKFAGCFPALEDELCGLIAGGGYEGPGASPDRADAMVWAMTELGKAAPSPSVRGL